MNIAFKDLPGLSALVRDYLYAFDKTEDFFNGDFRKDISFTAQIAKIHDRNLDREGLAALLRDQNLRWESGDRSLENIALLADKRACAVVTGQQTGLFSGPLYTVYKALTALRLAEDIGRKHGIPCIPIFWLASEDHDWGEVDHIELLTGEGELDDVRYPAPREDAKLPVSGVVLNEAIEDSLAKLAALTRDTEFKAGILNTLRDAYRPGLAFTEAFARWMARLFRAFGLVLMDGAGPEFKRMGRRVFRREIEADSPSTRRILETSGNLESRGYHIQVRLHPDRLNLFYAEGERQTLVLDAGGYSLKGTPRTFTKTELLALLETAPHLLSPNVLLRPLYQDSLLPTVAYIGGPGEIAYFAQLKGTYEDFDIPMPILYPRKSLTLLEKKAERILNKFGLNIPEVWRDFDSRITEILSREVPDGLKERIRETAGLLDREFAMLKRSATELDPSLEPSADLAVKKMKRQLDFLEDKILQAVKRKHTLTLKQLQALRNELHPGGRLQERVFSLVPYLIKYGPDLLQKINRDLDLQSFDHQVVELGP